MKKTYVLTVSQNFPKTHKRAGKSTGFVENITKLFSAENTKIHTIRSNYELWDKRAKQINEGMAVLSIRYWSGKPYNSKQVEIAVLEKIGIQRIEFDCPFCDYVIDGHSLNFKESVARNDGLSVSDFEEWFKKYDLSKPMAVIHFTEFRYPF